MTVLHLWLALPLWCRYAALAVTGLLLGSLVNWAVIHVSYFGSRVSPWSVRPAAGGWQTWAQKLPVWGWIILQREGYLTSTVQWLRPVFVECATCLSLPLLYWWECVERGLFPLAMQMAQPDIGWEAVVHGQFVAHAVLFPLLLAATLIDLDEKTIPDAITVPGTLFGLWWMAVCPQALLPFVRVVGDRGRWEPLWAWSGAWDSRWMGWQGLLVGWAILAVWGWGLLDKTCTFRRGIRRGLVYMVVSAVRRGSWRIVVPVVAVGGLAVTIGWLRQGEWWQTSFSAVLGLGFGGGVIWAVRVLGRWALRMEAMGFGDVTLMAMIGTYMGWQASLVVFFLAPLAGLVIALVQYMINRNHVIAFGPYLSLATLVVMIGWDPIWRQSASRYFELPGLVLKMLGVGLLLLGAVLWVWRVVRERFFDLEADSAAC